jgi:uncharacterized protein with HEPN domain
LKHILDEISFLEESSEGIDFEYLMENREKQRAWLRSLEVIGEATKTYRTNSGRNIPALSGKDCRTSR